MMERILQFGSKEIRYRLRRTHRKTLGIAVSPDLSVEVSAPFGAQIEAIEKIIRKRAPWIIRQENYFLSFHPRTPAPRYVSGESIQYLGKSYRLKLLKGKKVDVHRSRHVLEVTLPNRARAGKVVQTWLRQRAKWDFAEIAEPWIRKFARLGVNPMSIYLQKMPTRWGSCTPKGKIILNPELIQAPIRCIEYVIVHELCHLVHRSHNQKFFKLQKRMMPDWERVKERLERVMA